MAVGAENVAFCDLFQDAFLAPVTVEYGTEINVFRCGIAMVEMKAHRIALATAAAGLRALQLLPPHAELLAPAILPGDLLLRICAIPFSPRRVEELGIALVPRRFFQSDSE